MKVCAATILYNLLSMLATAGYFATGSDIWSDFREGNMNEKD